MKSNWDFEITNKQSLASSFLFCKKMEEEEEEVRNLVKRVRKAEEFI